MSDDENKVPPSEKTDLVQVDQALAVVEQRNRIMERLRSVAIQATSGYWIDHDGKPRLDSYGAEKAARVFGIKVTDKHWERIDHEDDGKGPHYEFIMQATFSLPGTIDRMEVIGTASSRDAFLGTETKKGRDISEVMPSTILKKAESNCTQRGITMLLGLRGMTWEQLAKYGVVPDESKKVSYKAGAQGGDVDRTWTFKFGSAKGKTPDQATDKEIDFYLQRAEEELGDPEKGKFKKNNEETVKRLQAEVARRKGVPPANGTSAPKGSVTAKVKEIAVDYEIPDDMVWALVRKAVGADRKTISEDDLPAIEKVFAEAVKDRVDLPEGEPLPGAN